MKKLTKNFVDFYNISTIFFLFTLNYHFLGWHFYLFLLANLSFLFFNIKNKYKLLSIIPITLAIGLSLLPEIGNIIYIYLTIPTGIIISLMLRQLQIAAFAINSIFLLIIYLKPGIILEYIIFMQNYVY